ncbi:MAG: flagellar motor switch protein FliN [Fibrobacteria bacterium]|nr:flagellar motor switch protein FliN [Fibrobacteria bacterium]
MSDDNFLNQNDIDALMDGLSASDSDAGNEESSDITSVVAANPDAVSGALEMVLRQASTVISTVLNKISELSIKSVDVANNENIYGSGATFKADCLSAKVTFSSGLEGDLVYLISKHETALLADLMMMGDGTAEYEEDHKDALVELVNQIMGAVCTSMGTEFGITITCEQTDVQEYAEGNTPFEVSNEAYLASIGMKIEDFDESEMLMFVSPELVSAFSTHYSSDSDVTNSSADADTNDEEMFPVDSSTDFINLDMEVQPKQQATYASTGNPNIDLLLDVPLDITIELGRANLSIRKILELGPGSIIELDRKATEPVDLLVNDKVVAKGEVVVVDEYFGIRIVSLISPEERIKHLR